MKYLNNVTNPIANTQSNTKSDPKHIRIINGANMSAMIILFQWLTRFLFLFQGILKGLFLLGQSYYVSLAFGQVPHDL